MQKIQSGLARGRPLIPLPKSFPVRPILGRIKKSLFDILQRRLPQCRFLDLYAGTGSVGLEALSRGALFCCFVEHQALCAKLINENLNKLQFSNKAMVVRSNVLGHLGHLPGPFDIIFMGPPYVDENRRALALTEPTLDNVDRYQLLSKQGIIVSQRHKKEPLNNIPPTFKIVRTEKYGDTVVTFIENNVHGALS